MKNLALTIACCIITFSAFSQVIIDEHFNSGKTPPPGWTYKVDVPYTNPDYAGDSIPSMKLSLTGHYIETDTFSGADAFSFWAKGAATDIISRLIFEVRIQDQWSNLDSLTNIHAGATYQYSLPVNVQKLRIKYAKSSGNIAFDDLKIFKIFVDSSAPMFTSDPMITNIYDTYCTAHVSLTNEGMLYYLAIPSDSVSPTCNEVMLSNNSLKIEKNVAKSFYITGLNPQTNYTLYFIKIGIYKTDSTIDTLTFKTQAKIPDLFFSKLYKGVGKCNKVIEVYNPTPDTLQLKNYRIRMSTNGAGWNTTIFKFPISAIILPNDVFVITKSLADSTIIPFKEVDMFTSSNVLGFTGNDARLLQKLNIANSWEDIDLYGDPKSSSDFSINGMSQIAGKYNLKRKSTCKSGNTNWKQSSGTDSLTSEWLLLPLSSYEEIGIHNVYRYNPLRFKVIQAEGQVGETVIDTLQNQIRIKLNAASNLQEVKFTYELMEGKIISPNLSKPIVYSRPFEVLVASVDNSDTVKWNIIIEQEKATVVKTTVTNEFQLYPNPCHGYIFIKSMEDKNEKVKYQILTIDGRIISTNNIKTDEKIRLNELPNGIYIMKIVVNVKNELLPFVIK